MNTINLKRKSSISIPLHLLLITPILLILLNGCGGGLKLTSNWQQNEMNIDGSDSQWQRGLYYNKESDFVYGVRNDEKYVYIFLKTQNRFTQMQIMRKGFTVWFDREGGKNQAFGIQYPMSRQEARSGFSSDTIEEKLDTFLDQTFPELEIIDPKKEDIQRFSTLGAPGIRVKLGHTYESLVYELRVPLKKTLEHPFAIEPISDRRIGIEFETGELKPEQSEIGMRVGSGYNRGEDNPTEEGGIGDRRFRNGGVQGGRFGNIDKTKQIKLWLSVLLAKSMSE